MIPNEQYQQKIQELEDLKLFSMSDWKEAERKREKIDIWLSVYYFFCGVAVGFGVAWGICHRWP